MNTSISYEGLEPIEELELGVLSPAKINEIIQKVNRLIELRNGDLNKLNLDMGYEMDREEFVNLFHGNSGQWEGDNAMQGLKIIEKYAPNHCVQGAGYDVLYSADVDELIDGGITRYDADELRRLNWMIEDGTFLACFV